MHYDGHASDLLKQVEKNDSTDAITGGTDAEQQLVQGFKDVPQVFEHRFKDFFLEDRKRFM